MIINVTASVPDHGQAWTEANCTQADYPVCFRFTDDPSFEGKIDAIAFDFTAGDFYRESWIADGVQKNEITHGDGTQECYLQVADENGDLIQGQCDSNVTITNQ